MTQYFTVQQVKCTGPDGCESRLEPLMDALLDLEDADETITDPDIAADTSVGRVDVQMTVEAADTLEAAVKARTVLRSAIHAIGDSTPGWETATATLHVTPVECVNLQPA